MLFRLYINFKFQSGSHYAYPLSQCCQILSREINALDVEINKFNAKKHNSNQQIMKKKNTQGIDNSNVCGLASGLTYHAHKLHCLVSPVFGLPVGASEHSSLRLRNREHYHK